MQDTASRIGVEMEGFSFFHISRRCHPCTKWRPHVSHYEIEHETAASSSSIIAEAPQNTRRARCFSSWKSIFNCFMIVFVSTSCAFSKATKLLSQEGFRSQTLFFWNPLKEESHAFVHSNLNTTMPTSNRFHFFYQLWIRFFQDLQSMKAIYYSWQFEGIPTSERSRRKLDGKIWMLFLYKKPQISQETRSFSVNLFPLRLWKSIASAWNSRYAGVLPFW